MDVSKTISPKSDQLNADDLIGESKTIKIREVRGAEDEAQPVSIFYEGDDNKPYKPCKSMRRVLVQLWGAESDNYIGRSLTVYRDTSVKWAGVEVGGIRISHASHIDAPTRVLLTVSKSKRRPITIEPIKAQVNKQKQTLTDERFVKALDALKEGKTTEAKIKDYDLTDEQSNQLAEFVKGIELTKEK